MSAIDESHRSPPATGTQRVGQDPTSRANSKVLRRLAAASVESPSIIDCDIESDPDAAPGLSSAEEKIKRDRDLSDDLGFDRPMSPTPPAKLAAGHAEAVDASAARRAAEESASQATGVDEAAATKAVGSLWPKGKATRPLASAALSGASLHRAFVGTDDIPTAAIPRRAREDNNPPLSGLSPEMDLAISEAWGTDEHYPMLSEVELAASTKPHPSPGGSSSIPGLAVGLGAAPSAGPHHPPQVVNVLAGGFGGATREESQPPWFTSGALPPTHTIPLSVSPDVSRAGRSQPALLRRPGTGPLSAIDDLAGADVEPTHMLSTGWQEPLSVISRYPWLLLIFALVISAFMIGVALFKRAHFEERPPIIEPTASHPVATATPLIDPPADAKSPAAQPAAASSPTAQPGQIPPKRNLKRSGPVSAFYSATRAGPGRDAAAKGAPNPAAAGRSATALLHRAHTLLDRGEHRAAHALYASLVADAQDALSGYAQSAAALGEGPALARFEALLAEHENLAQALRVRLLIANRRWRQADALYRRLPPSLRSQLRMQLWLAEIQTHRGKLKTAQDLYGKLLASPDLRHPGMRLQALLGYSDVLLRLERPKAALANARLAAQLAAAQQEDEHSVVSPELLQRIEQQIRRVQAALSRRR